MRALHLLPWLLALPACSDYNIGNNDKVEPAGPDTSAPEVPVDAPNLVISPDPLEWGNVLVDCPADAVITLSNDGAADLEITALRAAGSDGGTFQLPGSTPLPLVLAPGGSTTITLGFHPFDLRRHEAVLEVDSNDPDSPTTLASLIGDGVGAGAFEQSWRAEPTDKVDVLWVVDNSCSMEDAVDLVRVNMRSYVDQFLDLEVDYHLAAITTDMDDPTQQGRIQGEVITADWAPADAAAAFLSAVDVGAGGSSDEQGVGAVQAALSEPLLSAENAGLLRDDAQLAIVVITDEDDSSGVAANTFVRFLQGLKSDPSRVKVHGFVGLDFAIDLFGCTVDSASQTWIDSANLTGGFTQDICTDDYSAAMRSMSLASAGVPTAFALAARPDSLTTINVTIDSVRVRYDPANGWTWDEVTNTVSLHGSSIPLPGQTITITYTASTCG